MTKLCLCCGRELNNIEFDWHPSCIKKMFGSSKIPNLDFDEDEIIEDNIGNGNTITGVQKKFSLDINVRKSRKTVAILNSEYIVKTEQESLPNIVLFEWIGMKLAEICGIETVECGVLKKDNSYLFITKRIDRINGRKIAMEDFCQLSNTQTEYKYNGSYERCYKNVIEKYSNYQTIDKMKFYRLLVFSYIIGNTDMHLKNFSLFEIDDKYRLSPAYDLVPVLMVFKQEEMALTLNGKSKNLAVNDFLKFGSYLGIEERLILQINKEVYDKRDKICEFIKKTELNDENKKRFIDFINERINMFK